MKKSFFLWLCILFILNENIAQTSIGNQRFSRNPVNFTPATPEVAAFQKYGDLPVNLQHGLVNINIPIGSLKLKNFEWPISLSYHTGGIRLDEIASNVGLGWTLNAAGIWSYKVIGKPGRSEAERRLLDLSYTHGGGYDLGECRYNNEQDVQLAENVVAGATDFQPDLSYLNTPLFNLKGFDNVFYPATDIKGCETKVTIDGISRTFTTAFIDTKGNRYYFSDIGVSNFSYSCYSTTGVPINRSYVLSYLITYEGFVLSFEYITKGIGYKMTPVQYKTSIDPFAEPECKLHNSPMAEYCESNYGATEAFLTKITSSNGDIINFNYSTRNDINNGLKVDEILFKKVANGAEILLKRVSFEYDYFTTSTITEADDYRLKLTKVKYYDRDNLYQNQYTLEYNSLQLPNRVKSKAIDWFGYYNGANSNSSLLTSDGVNRDAAPFYAKACSLEKITYPTGGYTTISYEMNPWGGLRIKNLKDYNHLNTIAKFKTYDYHKDEGNGNNYGLVFDDYIINNTLVTKYLDPTNPSTAETFVYKCYIKRENSSPVVNTIMNFIANENYYSHVTEVLVGNVGVGKTEYYYGNTANVTGPDVFVPQNIDLLKKESYKQIGAGYELVEEIKNSYDPVTNTQTPLFAESPEPLETRFWIREITKTQDEMSYGDGSLYNTKYLCKEFNDIIFCVASVPIRLTKTIEKKYQPNNSVPLIIESQYYYEDPFNLQPTRVETQDSKGKTQVIKNTYATNSWPATEALSNAEQLGLSALKDHNLITSPVYTERQINGASIFKSVKKYQLFHNKPIQSIQLDYLRGDTYYRKYSFDNYDNHLNLLQLTEDGNFNSIYLWGYNSQYPVAKILGIDFNTVNTKVDTAILNNGTDAQIQQQLSNLRNVFASNPLVQVFTYTYTPLIGMTSETDPKGNTTYYEYDGFGRLMHAKDKDGNIIKKYDYHYQNQ